MPRYKLIIEYDGTAFAGWQTQTHPDKRGLTIRETGTPAAPRAVQDALEDALFAITHERARIGGAGRTDAGVHATGQIAHVDLAKDWRLDRLRDGINAMTRRHGDHVAVLAAEHVPDDFDARFSARKRHYLYRILNRRAPPAFDFNRVWHVPRKLDVALMGEAAQHLLGQHDFTTFRATECQAKSPIKTLDVLDVARVNDEVHVRASARSFLHNQVRSMVGTLAEVGWGRFAVNDVRLALQAKDRSRCGIVAPPQGLYLVGVEYE
ncbi:MAG: tRNA pseudouridine(38-40) synthase TruA [Beijerinckiaceae bacterium]